MTDRIHNPEADEEDTGPAVTTAVPMGEQLRTRREAAGLSVEDVARSLKLQPRQVAGVEAGDFSAVGGAPFRKGFLRNYARVVGFDVGSLIENPDEKPQKVDDLLRGSAGPSVAMPEPGKRKPLTWVVATSPLILVALVGAILFLTGIRLESFFAPQAAPPQPVVAVPAPLPKAEPAPVLPAPVLPAGAEQGAVPAGSQAALPQAVPTASVPVQTGPAPGPQAGPVSAPAAGAVPAAVTPASAPPVAPAPGVRKVAITVQSETWVEIRSEGKALHSQKVPAGQTASVQGKAPFTIIIGNAKGTQLRYDDQDVDLAPHTKVNVARLTLN